MTETPFSTPAALAAALTIGAGLVHGAAAGTHTGDATLVWLFAATAVVQVALGAMVLARSSRLLLAGIAVMNAAVAAAWVVSRTRGLPLVDSLRATEAVGLQDLVANVLAFVAVAAALVAIRRAGLPSRPARPVLVALAVVPALVGVAAPHAHSEDHAHGAHEHGADEGLASDPVFAGADTSGSSEEELAAAKELIETTRAAVGARFSDEASVRAAGYQSIGDGQRAGGYEHFVNHEYLTDGRTLDTERVESLVFANTGSGKQLVSAMFVLESGSTMADVPDVAGDLTAWHDHQNLCWDESGTKVAGLLVDGRCVPGGTLRATPPMLHVWLSAQECGPFAGIEGHGAGCTHDHAH